VDAIYQYDALTRRIVTDTAAETRHFYFNNQWRTVEERVSGAVMAQYVWNPADRWDLIRRRRSVAGTLDETRFVLRDYLDPAAIINPGGVVTERYRYDAFGPAAVLAPDFSARTTSECAWTFLYHAEFQDAETGLYNYGYRYYHPNLGRWPSRDPIEEEGGINLYEFVGNGAIYQIDILGLLVPQNPAITIIREDKVNCFGYACGEINAIRPTGTSFNNWLSVAGYNCTKDKSAKECHEHCGGKCASGDCLMIYMYVPDTKMDGTTRNDEQMRGIGQAYRDIIREANAKKMSSVDPFDLVWERVNLDNVDFHALKCEPGGRYTFQPTQADKGSKGSKKSKMDYTLKGGKKFTPTAERPDYFDSFRIISKACCCKKVIQPKTVDEH
jgi:RHS repeat-associated protein